MDAVCPDNHKIYKSQIWIMTIQDSLTHTHTHIYIYLYFHWRSHGNQQKSDSDVTWATPSQIAGISICATCKAYQQWNLKAPYYWSCLKRVYRYQWILFTKSQRCMMTLSNVNIFRATGPMCGEFTGHRWIPHTKACDAELWCFLWYAREYMVE